MVGFVQIFPELLPSLFGIFAEQRQRTFVLTRRMQFDVDLFIFQETIEVRDLRNHPNRADNGERCCDDFIRHARHHIAATRRDLIYRHGERDLFIPQTL